ncbi:FecCD family ABC transporter permease [Amycolatopsis suaedae]|uniref:Iron ABC transporter permease n=1 Tax=Amycolatopsis suaedae TaxID=2510978 RepID=A0A4Q7JDT1_9PSEU|nr:iron chelate uptake ABC transporter family permease subunit [Amycolatopsis suaedae]RZQ65358.1 iron ABC transporter permease [Amycolatopsis suaedae]
MEHRGRWLGLSCVALLAVLVASVALGARAIPLDVVWQAITAPTGSETDIVIRSLRVPRTVLGLLVGLALGAAGALMQGHTRNPLADPGLLGVNQGAAFAVVLAVVTLDVHNLYAYVWFGFAGALVASVVVFTLGSVGGRGSTPVTLALAGAAVSALLHGLVATMVLADRQGMETYRFWHVGSIAGRDYTTATQILPFLLVGLVLAVANAPGMNTLALGTDVATALGQRVRWTRAVGVLAITLLTGAAVAACGPIAFLGLVVPHVARAVTGPDYRWLVPFSAVLGAVLLLSADVLGRVVSGDTFEVGILLALIGAPAFIVLVRRKGMVRL